MTFAEFVADAGLRPRQILPDGTWRRCPTESHPRKRNGAYCLAPDGRIGWVQDWSVDTSPRTWRPDGAATPGTAREAISAAEIRRRHQEDQARQQRAMVAARAAYDDAAPLIGGHPYLDAHGLDMAGCRGLRVDAVGWLVVPMRRAGAVVSVQRIAPDGDKRFWPGAPTGGAGYAIQRPGAPVTILCEGLATGLSLYAAVPAATVVVAFNAGNLPRIAAALTRRGLMAVAADNDHETETRIGRNPGVDYAREAAAVLGCDVAIPTGIRGTDWCDYVQERLAAALEPVHGRRTPSEGAARRAVHAEINAAVMRAARYVARAG